VPEVAASVGVVGTPRPGAYPFRQQGAAIVGDRDPVFLPPETTRTVSEPRQVVAGIQRFDVTVEQYGTETTTTYQIDQRGIDDSIAIAQIRTTDELGTQAFTPSVPVKVLQLPAQIDATWSSTGSDPLSATAMTVHGRIIDRQRVDACGTVVDGWRIEVGPDPDSGAPSGIVSKGERYELTATFVIATQLGGLLVFDDVTLTGNQGVELAEIRATSTVSSIEPGAVP
jgi:hypothetical protein